MRSSIIYGSMVTILVVSSGCQSGMPRWDWWRSASNSSNSAANIAQSNAPALPSSVASSGVSAPTGQYAATTYPTTPVSAYATPNMANATPVSAPPTAGAVGPQTSPYNPNAYGTPAGAAGYAGSQPAYAPSASPSGTANTGYANAGYANTATSGPASGSDGRYGTPAASRPLEYQSGSRYDSPATSYNPMPQSPAAVATSGSNVGAYPSTNGYGVANTSAEPVDYRNQAPVSTADARSQYSPVQNTAAALAAPTSTAGTPYRPAGTGTYTPVGVGARSGISGGTQPASYQQAAPAGQYNPATAKPAGSDSRYGERY